MDLRSLLLVLLGVVALVAFLFFSGFFGFVFSFSWLLLLIVLIISVVVFFVFRSGRLESFEVWVILLVALFGLVWQLLLVPFLPSFPFWLSLNPLFQYILYNVGFVCLFVAILGTGFDLLLGKGFDFVFAFRSGLASFLVFSMADLWQPPFAYSSCGQLLISDVFSLSGAAVDRMLGFVFESIVPFLSNVSVDLFGVCLSLKYVFIYFFVPLFVLFLAACLFAGEKFLGVVFERFK